MAAEHQKIHPVDLEAPPKEPLVPRGSLRSDAGHPIDDVEKYPPAVNRIFPVVHSRPPKKKRSCCCRCFCWTISLLLLLVIIIAAVVGILYLVFRPKIPSYSIDRLRVTEFTVSNNMSLAAKFIVRFTAQNPNKKIGIYYYEDGSNLSAWYTSAELCQGLFPTFYQGHKNTTVLDIELTGQIADGNALLQEVLKQQQTGSIPLIIYAKVPVRVKLGKLKLMRVKPHVKCNLVVDTLTQNNLISIKHSSCKLKKISL